MKILLILSLIIFTSLYSNAQDTHIHCGYDSTFYAQDPVIAKIEFGNPTLYSLTDTIMDLNKTRYSISSPITERMTIWVTIIDSNGEEKELISETEFHFDCNRSEVVLLTPELLRNGSVLQINWICRGKEK